MTETDAKIINCVQPFFLILLIHIIDIPLLLMFLQKTNFLIYQLIRVINISSKIIQNCLKERVKYIGFRNSLGTENALYEHTNI